MHESEVAVLHEVEQWHVRRLVLLGDRHHEAEVAVDEAFDCGVSLRRHPAQLAPAGGGEIRPPFQLGPGLASRLGSLGQPDLVVLAQQRVATDVIEVETDEVLIGRLNSLVGHWHSSLGNPR